MRPIAILLALSIPVTLSAQEAHGDHGPAPKFEGGGVFPPGWAVRVDEGTPAQVKLATMAPGWHVNTATSAIFYRDKDQASGAYEVSAKMHLFPEGPGHLEALGIFIGGSDLQGPAQRYTYFIIRGDGTFKVKRRSGAAATDVSGNWIASPAIVRGKPEGSVANVLSIAVTHARVSFRVNGQEVYSAPAAGLDTDGIVGLRINHNLSVHVENLEVKKQ
jgi:hypothetical protein